jgi:hypothetical protein
MATAERTDQCEAVSQMRCRYHGAAHKAISHTAKRMPRPIKAIQLQPEGMAAIIRQEFSGRMTVIRKGNP